jgi:hypothetical protein
VVSTRAGRRWLREHRARLDVALTPGGYRADLRTVARRFIELPLKEGEDDDAT